MARKKTGGATKEGENPKRRQVDVDEILFRQCGTCAQALGISIPEYVNSRLRMAIENEMVDVVSAIFPDKKKP